MIANSPDKYKEMDTMELLKLLQRYHEKLDEYVEAAKKTMDEPIFRQSFEIGYKERYRIKRSG